MTPAHARLLDYVIEDMQQRAAEHRLSVADPSQPDTAWHADELDKWIECLDALREALAAVAPQESQKVQDNQSRVDGEQLSGGQDLPRPATGDIPALVPEFNVNHYVWVKITEAGRKWLHEKDPLAWVIPEDINGWSQWQLWDLMNTFGPVMTMGFNPPIETTIRLQAPEPPTSLDAVDPSAGIRESGPRATESLNALRVGGPEGARPDPQPGHVGPGMLNQLQSELATVRAQFLEEQAIQEALRLHLAAANDSIANCAERVAALHAQLAQRDEELKRARRLSDLAIGNQARFAKDDAALRQEIEALRASRDTLQSDLNIALDLQAATEESRDALVSGLRSLPRYADRVVTVDDIDALLKEHDARVDGA